MKIYTKRPKRPFPAFGDGVDTSGSESAREIARRMAFEGAMRLRRSEAMRSPALGGMAEDNACPLSRRAWPVQFLGRPVVAAIAALLISAPSMGQVANANPAALGLGENYTALAAGLDAVSWNPAALSLAGGPRFVALAVRGASGLGPVGLSDIADWSNTLVPVPIKQDWSRA